jgi:hypothetical protein
MDIRGAAGKGTTVKVRMPLPTIAGKATAESLALPEPVGGVEVSCTNKTTIQ